MMTINFRKQLFRILLQKSLLVLLFFELLISCSQKRDFQVEPLQTPTGWGYTISLENKIIIKQTIIPVISEIKSFHSKKEALKVGQLVVEKLNQNIVPSVTKNDLILLKIKL